MAKDVAVVYKKSGMIIWQVAAKTEIVIVKITFQIIPNAEKALNGYMFVNYHMVFVIEM